MAGDSAPPANSPLRAWNDWQEDPWAPPEVKAQRRRERHARWIASLSDRDWERLAVLVDQVDGASGPAALNDLDAPIRVGAAHPDEAGRFSGEGPLPEGTWVRRSHRTQVGHRW